MKKVLILDGGAAHAMAIAECLQKDRVLGSRNVR